METPLSEDTARRLDIGYRLLFENNPLPMWVYDVQTLRMLAVNDAALAQYGYSKQAFVGLSVLDLHPPGQAAQAQQHLQLAPGAPVNQKLWQHRLANGELIDVEVVTEYVELDGIQARLALVRDLTAQRSSEQQVREEHQTLSAVLDSTTDAIISITVDGEIKVFNPGAERIFGYSREQMLGQNMALLLPERYRLAHPQQLHSFAESGATSHMMGMGIVKGLRADGQELDLEGTLSQVHVQHERRLIACLRDVTERARSEAQFQQSRAQLSELTQRLMTQEKTLVKQLAKALHDQLGQTLAAVRMAHETIQALQPKETPAAVQRQQAQLGKLIGQSIHQVRQVLVDLRPPLLEDQGLIAALDNELRNRSLTHPEIDFSIDVPPETEPMRWPSEVEYAAFMVAREALENALRHANASTIAVRLEGTAMSLHLQVLDNGVGIEVGATAPIGHLGVFGMHERAQAIGATVTVGAAEGQGARVRFSWQPGPASPWCAS
ncbi:MAG: PAS domain S-box protein [Rhodoferax sp.]|uniref:PAS domain-containing sensor histidine kinase n=1 Tax=Rhodoferax sp. TaxID=50421 RepID=UPI0014010168|nr:PAS domain-containing sensor histidine kinase [Rhodoferax sp.]NDP39731.1 PAS domain S-box protein [Rhodoferax sp.]